MRTTLWQQMRQDRQLLGEWDNSPLRFPAFAWPGGYPIIYLDHDNEVLCADCATKERADVEAYDVFYEGAPVYCAECNVEIESAYGDPEADNE